MELKKNGKNLLFKYSFQSSNKLKEFLIQKRNSQKSEQSIPKNMISIFLKLMLKRKVNGY